MNTTPPVEIILTHEYADFDALASLAAASLLYPNAHPVLPRRINRNVRKFLTRFRANFPFLTADDFPLRVAGPNSQRLAVDHVILVDTASARMVKGMKDHTTFSVIDHHVLQDEHPEGWEVWSEQVGANTTLIVERLIEKKIPMPPLYATLFAIGIHHDTGSFTHNITTHRDIRCLAWLMEPEREVDIDIISLYLTYPLGKGQRKLFQRLIENSELTDINGNRIVITQVEAKGHSDEFSTLASRVRDFFEAEAIFLIFEKQEMIQIVARSTTDNVNVGAITRAFGGGGHLQAAAAAARTQDMIEVYTQLIPLIHEHSKAPIAVGNIMEAEPTRLLRADQTIAEAAQLMGQDCAIECPVVTSSPKTNEALLGVLNRREVDQAMNYQLGDQPIRRFMRAGLRTVSSTDALETLRQVMVENQWSQVPVVDTVDGSPTVVGIATQTKLLAAWGASIVEQQPAMLDWQLQYKLSFTAYHFLKFIGVMADQSGLSAYIVGGFVRDLLLATINRSPTSAKEEPLFDFDIVVEGNAIEFAEQLQSTYGGRLVTHQRFGTGTWYLTDPQYPIEGNALSHRMRIALDDVEKLPIHLDFITARSESYATPAALPTVEPSCIQADLQRRDFSINTLAIHLNAARWGLLLDQNQGLDAIHKRRVEILHPMSFVDDPTRIFRAARYEQRFNYQIDYRTVESLQDGLSFLDLLTPARLRHEFERIFQERFPERTLQRLDELGVLKQLHPQLHFGEAESEAFVMLRKSTDFRKREKTKDGYPLPEIEPPLEPFYWGVWLYLLSTEVDDWLVERLGFSKERQRFIADIRTLQQNLERLKMPELRPIQAVSILDGIAQESLMVIQLLCRGRGIQQVFRQYTEEWSQIHPVLNGNDLQQLDIPAGPIYKEMLQQLRNGRLEKQLNSREEEIDFVRQWLQEYEFGAENGKIDELMNCGTDE